MTTVRSFKKCDKDAMLSDLDRAPWHVMEVFSSVDEMCMGLLEEALSGSGRRACPTVKSQDEKRISRV